jgi:HAD superfamily hydrolase (TIGR01490 family)
MKEIVVFDVDNTIIQGFSQEYFVNFLRKRGEISFYQYFSLILKVIFYKWGLLKDPKGAMKQGLFFIKGKSTLDAQKIVNEFFNNILIKKIYPEALKIIKKHQNSDRIVILISNAPDVIVECLAKYLNLTIYISTKLEEKEGIYTGEIIGEIMYGKQKLNALNSYISSQGLSLENSWGYGDHESDASLLSEVSHPFAVNPSKGLKKIALKNKWPILNFKL